MFDLCMMREQFSNRICKWKRTVTHVSYENIQGYEYFHEGEDDQDVSTSIEIFMTTENSDKYEHRIEGAISNIEYSCYADYDVIISNEDFIKYNNNFYKIKELARILHPVSGEEIGKNFLLQKISLVDDSGE